jgi:hypothetical protein
MYTKLQTQWHICWCNRWLISLSQNLLHIHSSINIDISTEVMLVFWLFRFNTGSWSWELCLLISTMGGVSFLFFSFPLCYCVVYVVQIKCGKYWSSSCLFALVQDQCVRFGFWFLSVSHCYNTWKHCHFCIGRAQSIQSAVMKQTTGLSHIYVRQPSPTTLTTNWGLHWLSLSLCVTKKWFSCQLNRQIQENVSYRLGSLCVTLRALVQIRLPLSDPVMTMSCGTLCWPPNHCWLVAVLLQGNGRFHFAFFPTFFGGVVGGRSLAKLWK